MPQKSKRSKRENRKCKRWVNLSFEKKKKKIIDDVYFKMQPNGSFCKIWFLNKNWARNHKKREFFFLLKCKQICGQMNTHAFYVDSDAKHRHQRPPNVINFNVNWLSISFNPKKDKVFSPSDIFFPFCMKWSSSFIAVPQACFHSVFFFLERKHREHSLFSQSVSVLQWSLYTIFLHR